MSKKHGFLPLALVAALLFGCLISGCSENAGNGAENSGGSSESSDASSEESIIEEDVIGEVSYIGSTYVSVTVCISDTDIDDYANADTGSLTLTDGTQSITTDADTEYCSASGGELVPAKREDIAKGDIIAFTSSGGTRRIIILQSASEAFASCETAVAEVTASYENGGFSLSVYALSEEAAGYELTDAVSAELGNYAASGKTVDYSVPEGASLRIVREGVAEEISADDIAVGDMLVIQNDASSGAVLITVHRSEAVE
ncbi:MAG: hypothetical protein ACI4IW_05285 [Oscillospiraceae bacterium]